MNWLDLLFWEVVLAGAVRLATPLIFAALGEMLTERSGLINLGVNGIMTAGAFAAVVGSSMFGWTGGLLTAAIVGGLYGLLIAFSVIKGGANQIIVGIAIAFVGTGLTDYLFKIWQPSGQSAMFVPLVPTLKIPGLAEMPFFGQVLFSHTLLTYAALALLAGISFYMARTRGGLRLRAVGDDPEGAGLQGIRADRIRMAAVIVGGVLMGIGGAAITIGFLGSFTSGVVAGRGYVALAVVIIGRWTPAGALVGALLFAFFDSLSLRSESGFAGVPTELFYMLPYAATLFVLVLSARGKAGPRALGREPG